MMMTGLKQTLARLALPLRRFAWREDGAVVAETVIVLPLLLWSYIGLYVYWDSFRSLNTVQKAAYTISDMISRQQTGINNTYVTGLHKVLDYLIDDVDQPSILRVTSLTWSDANQRFEVHWSRSTDTTTMPQLTTTTLQNYVSMVPTMSAGDYVVVVEVRVPYVPAFNVGMGDQTFREFIVTRPRFLPCIPMDNVPCPVT